MRGVNEPFQVLARIGYSARGVIYVVVGYLALMTALGAGGRTTGPRGAILEILYQPQGRILLGLLIAGLVGYVLWRFVQAILDPDRHGLSLKGLLIRGGLLASAVTHSVLVVWSTKLLMADQDEGGGSGGPMATVLASQVGQWLLIGVGLVLIGVGGAHLFKGWTARFERHMHVPDWARPVCQFGLMARGVVWCLMGWFLMDSVYRFNSSDVEGTGQTLERLQGSPFGEWTLAVVAVGLVAFGLYSFLEAVYRRVSV